MLGFPVLQCLPEFAQIHVHSVGDAIQPSHPVSPSHIMHVCYMTGPSGILILCSRACPRNLRSRIHSLDDF